MVIQVRINVTLDDASAVAVRVSLHLYSLTGRNVYQASQPILS